jgi:hypothetical protein
MECFNRRSFVERIVGTRRRVLRVRLAEDIPRDLGLSVNTKGEPEPFDGDPYTRLAKDH